MRTISRRELLALTGVGLLASASSCQKDVRKAWNDVLKKCAVNDFLSDNVLFFGASNEIGPGSIWRNMPEGGYALRWLIKDPPLAPVAGHGGTCTGNAKASFDASGGAQLDNQMTPVSGDLKVEFKRAKQITIQPTAFQWYELVEGEYEQYIKTKADVKIREDLTAANARLIMGRALRVEGFSAELVFDSNTGVDVKGKVREGALPVTDLGFNGTAKWTGNTHLTISSQSPTFMAGELRKYTGGFAGPNSKILGDRVSVGNQPVVLKDPQLR